MRKRCLGGVAICGLAFLSALNYSIFVFPNRFAPAGVDGVCTMIQDVLHINMGYLAFLVNIPLLIAAFFVLSRDFAVKSTLFVAVFSLSAVLLGEAELTGLRYATAASPVLAPVAAGAVRGLLYAATLKLNGSAGGIDIISALIKHKRPYLDFMHIIFAINMLIAVCSYFVYGMGLEPVLCSILYAFVTSAVCNKLRGTEGRAVKFEILTREPEALCDCLGRRLSLQVTVLDAGSEKMLVCAVKKELVPFVEEALRAYPECRVYKSAVSSAVTGVTYK